MYKDGAGNIVEEDSTVF